MEAVGIEVVAIVKLAWNVLNGIGLFKVNLILTQKSFQFLFSIFKNL
jgi:hypothetical protein